MSADQVGDWRSFLRYALWFPVTLHAGTSEVRAICRDASAGGMQVSSEMPLPVGTRLSAVFRLARGDSKTYTVEAEIIRSTMNEDDLTLVFPFVLGLRFAQPLPELPDALVRAGQTRLTEP